MVMALELKLHSPAGAEPAVYQWPLTSGRGAVSSEIPAIHSRSLQCYSIQILSPYITG